MASLAHEAQEIVPEAVVGTKDAMRDEEYEVTAAVEATYDADGNELTVTLKQSWVLAVFQTIRALTKANLCHC
jgi:hypothetical protein